MTATRWKAVIMVLACAIALGGASAWRPTHKLADTRPRVDLHAMFPSSFGDWATDTHVPVQLVSPDTQAMLDKIYNQTLARTYVDARGQRVMLSVAYGGDQSDGTRAHRPEVCYPAQGFEIVANRVGSVALERGELRVRELVAREGQRIEPIRYWVVVGERLALSGTEQKLAQLRYSTRGWIPDGILMRVSSIDPDPAHAHRVQAQFIQQLFRAVAPADRPHLFGEAAMADAAKVSAP